MKQIFICIALALSCAGSVWADNILPSLTEEQALEISRQYVIDEGIQEWPTNDDFKIEGNAFYRVDEREWVVSFLIFHRLEDGQFSSGPESHFFVILSANGELLDFIPGE